MKQALLGEGARGRIAVADMDVYLHAASAMHRAYGQMLKAAELRSRWTPLMEDASDADEEH